MNWSRIILDGISMSLLFNAMVGVGFLLWPQAFSTMFPKEIRQAHYIYNLGMSLMLLSTDIGGQGFFISSQNQLELSMHT